MLPKDKRCYIRAWFNTYQQFNDGDILEFKMPSFCSGDYEARIYIDSDGDPYINRLDSYYDGCRDFSIKGTTTSLYKVIYENGNETHISADSFIECIALAIQYAATLRWDIRIKYVNDIKANLTAKNIKISYDLA